MLRVLVLALLLAGCAVHPGDGAAGPPRPRPTPYVSPHGPILNLRLSFTAGDWIYVVTTPTHRSDRPLILSVRVFHRDAANRALPRFHLEDSQGQVIRPRFADPIPGELREKEQLAAYLTYPVSMLTQGLVFVVDPDPEVPFDEVRYSLDSGRVHYPARP